MSITPFQVPKSINLALCNGWLEAYHIQQMQQTRVILLQLSRTILEFFFLPPCSDHSRENIKPYRKQQSIGEGKYPNKTFPVHQILEPTITLARTISMVSLWTRESMISTYPWLTKPLDNIDYQGAAACRMDIKGIEWVRRTAPSSPSFWMQ